MRKKAVIVACFLAVGVSSFLIGRRSGPQSAISARRVLYYVDPMHPSYHSDKPGTAPDCGMDLEPFYQDQATDSRPTQLASGAVLVSSAQQQVLGLRVEKLERGSASRTIRTTGRVALDDDDDYRLLAATDGWVKTRKRNAPGTFVRKNEILATFYSNDFLRAQQSFFFALKNLDRVTSSGHDSDEQTKQAEDQVRTGEDELRSLGMGEPQIKEIRKVREVTREIVIASPVDGIVVARNLSPGQRLERGTELYRIANLRQVLILADLFPGVAVPAPGTKVGVNIRELAKTVFATVDSNLPLFDPASRVLKLRLKVDNPGFLLRPDMFVDVEFNQKFPYGLTVPADAVLDGGLKKIVYVESSDGVFEPREVEIGGTFGGRVVVERGLAEGDRIVTAGNFMIDSESRMRAPAVENARSHPETGSPQAGPVDPVCGMSLSRSASKRVETYHGRTFSFCSEQCRKNFLKQPAKYADDKIATATVTSGGIGTP